MIDLNSAGLTELLHPVRLIKLYKQTNRGIRTSHLQTRKRLKRGVCETGGGCDAAPYNSAQGDGKKTGPFDHGVTEIETGRRLCMARKMKSRLEGLGQTDAYAEKELRPERTFLTERELRDDPETAMIVLWKAAVIVPSRRTRVHWGDHIRC